MNPQRLVAQQLSLAFDAPDTATAATASASPPLQPSAPTLEQPIPLLPNGVRVYQMRLGGRPFEFRLRRGKRRTIGFQIDDAGLTVAAPRWVSLKEILAAISEKERWIGVKLSEWHAWTARRRLPQVHWAHGGTLPYLGQTITLCLSDRTAFVPMPAQDELHLALPPDASADQIKDSAVAWLHAQARTVFAQRMESLTPTGTPRPRVWALSSARRQWGSCTHDGRIRLNWRLIHFALPVIDYVIAHELAHLQELNHSPNFWNAVSRLLPGFEAARDQIKKIDLGSLPA